MITIKSWTSEGREFDSLSRQFLSSFFQSIFLYSAFHISYISICSATDLKMLNCVCHAKTYTRIELWQLSTVCEFGGCFKLSHFTLKGLKGAIFQPIQSMSGYSQYKSHLPLICAIHRLSSYVPISWKSAPSQNHPCEEGKRNGKTCAQGNIIHKQWSTGVARCGLSGWDQKPSHMRERPGKFLNFLAKVYNRWENRRWLERDRNRLGLVQSK